MTRLDVIAWEHEDGTWGMGIRPYTQTGPNPEWDIEYHSALEASVTGCATRELARRRLFGHRDIDQWPADYIVITRRQSATRCDAYDRMSDATPTTH